jgi:alkanesulfonate monooxygenase SsuD/methylene tetrahydromethanopterin reductase-like flavin-dependent oxidoreductase (luciferase family)
MIRKNWIVRYRPPETPESIKSVFDEVNPYGYGIVLVTVSPLLGDMWTRISSVVDKSHTFKYMIAFRAYLFSPQYLAMLISSFNQISNNRLMLNLVHGNVRNNESFDGIIANKEMLLTNEGRREHSKEFVDKLFHSVKMFEPFEMPEILVSGGSDDSIYLAKNTSNIIGLYYESFMKSPERFTSQNFDKIFVFLSVLVFNTDEEAEERISNMTEHERSLDGSPIYGSKETLKKKILELESLGVTDIFFSQFNQYEDTIPVHEFLKELTEEGILS